MSIGARATLDRKQRSLELRSCPRGLGGFKPHGPQRASWLADSRFSPRWWQRPQRGPLTPLLVPGSPSQLGAFLLKGELVLALLWPPNLVSFIWLPGSPRGCTPPPWLLPLAVRSGAQRIQCAQSAASWPDSPPAQLPPSTLPPLQSSANVTSVVSPGAPIITQMKLGVSRSRWEPGHKHANKHR